MRNIERLVLTATRPADHRDRSCTPPRAHPGDFQDDAFARWQIDQLADCERASSMNRAIVCSIVLGRDEDGVSPALETLDPVARIRGVVRQAVHARGERRSSVLDGPHAVEPSTSSAYRKRFASSTTSEMYAGPTTWSRIPAVLEPREQGVCIGDKRLRRH